MVETAYLFQAVLILAWWVGISFSDAWYRVFEFPEISRNVFFAFLIPDVVVICVLSLIRGYRASRDLQLIILGAFLYATLFCLNSLISSGGGLIPTTVMTVGLCYNLFLCYGERSFRTSRSSGFFINGMKTLVQIISIWFVSLFLIPFLLLKEFRGTITTTDGIPLWLGTSLFLASSLLGLWSAFVLVKYGQGTPLPLDQTNALVENGPYRFIRNPMAVAGIGQGIAISIAYLSIPIFCYSILGALVWHFIVRPFEEQDMVVRFGQPYIEYRSRVRCWIP